MANFCFIFSLKIASQPNIALNMSQVTPAEFESLGRGLAGFKDSNSYDTKRRRFVSFFGVEPAIVSVVWSLLFLHNLIDLNPRQVKPIHLLWTLLFVQCYEVEERNAARCKCDEKTFRKWSWYYLKALAALDIFVVSSVIVCGLAFAASLSNRRCRLSLKTDGQDTKVMSALSM